MAAASIRDQILKETYTFIDKRVSELLGDVLSEAALAAYSKSLKAGLRPDLDARIIEQFSQQPVVLATTIDKAKADFIAQVDKARAEFAANANKAQTEFAAKADKTKTELEMLRTFINTPLPLGWRDYPIEARREFWAGDHSTGVVKRNKICGLEVWMELFNNSRSTYAKSEARRINKMLAACCPGWELRSSIRYGDLYGFQRGFINVSLEGD